MTWVELLQAVGGLSAGLAAVLAWVAKIRWSAEYKEAKEAQIAATEARLREQEERIRTIEALSAPKLRDHFVALRQAYDEADAIAEKLLKTSSVSPDAERATSVGDEVEHLRHELLSVRAHLEELRRGASSTMGIAGWWDWDATEIDQFSVAVQESLRERFPSVNVQVEEPTGFSPPPLMAVFRDGEEVTHVSLPTEPHLLEDPELFAVMLERRYQEQLRWDPAEGFLP